MDMSHEQQDLQTPSCRAQYQAGGDEADQRNAGTTTQHQGMDRAASRQDPETSRGQRRLEEDHQNICGAGTYSHQRLRAADADDADVPTEILSDAPSLRAVGIFHPQRVEKVERSDVQLG